MKSSSLYAQELPPDAFRLMQYINPPEAASERHKLQFTLSVTTADQAPPYDALSYRWEDPDPSLPDIYIVCNNVKIPVGMNLYAALSQILVTPGRSDHIWVDYICIQQSNLSEKQVQILRMPQLYSGAYRVIIWLGTANESEGSDQAMDLFPVLVMCLNAVDHPYLSTNEPLGPDSIKVRDTLLRNWNTESDPRTVFVWKLLARPWFGRAWTLQEAALGKANCIVMCGTKTVRYSLFQHFAEKASSDQIGHWASASRVIRSREYGSDPDNPTRPPLMHLMATSRMRKAVSSAMSLTGVDGPVIRILNSLRMLDCVDPKDRIFSVSAFLPEQLTGYLRAQGPLSIEDLYLKFAEIELGQNNNLHCLGAAGLSQHRVSYPDRYAHEPKSHTLRLPSWVSDWTYRKINDPQWVLDADLMEHRGQHLYDVATHLVPEIILEANAAGCRIASVRGAIVDNVSLRAEPYRIYRLPRGFDAQKQGDIILEMMLDCKKQVDDMVFLAQHHYRPNTEMSPLTKTTIIRRTIIGNRIPATSTSYLNDSLLIRAPQDRIDPIFEDFENAISEVRQICEQASKVKSVTDGATQQSIINPEPAAPANLRVQPSLITAASGMCKGRRFFVTSNGGIGIGPDITRKGDMICIIYGACTPFIIRPVTNMAPSDGRSYYNLVGECYIHGFMDGEISQMDDLVSEMINLV